MPSNNPKIKKFGLREFGKFPRIVRITFPLWNYEDLKDMASRVLLDGA